MEDGCVYLSIFIAQISLMIGATSLTWSSPMIPKLLEIDDNPIGRPITSMENSLLASLPILGVACGSIICGIISNNYGRKTILFIFNLPYLISFLTMAVTNNIYILFVCRLITGVSMGVVLITNMIYVGEVAKINKRGIFGCSAAVFNNLGTLIPFIIGPFYSFFWFHMILAILSLIHLPLLYFKTIESPYYYLDKNKEKAEILFKKLGKEMIKETVEEKSKISFFEILSSKGTIRALIIGFGAFTFYALSGISMINSYFQTIFELTGMSLPSKYGPIIVTVAQCISTVLSSFIADKFSRKFLLTVSHLGVFLTYIPVGLYFILKQKGFNVDHISYLPLICLIIAVSSMNLGMTFIPPTLLGEIFSPQLKEIAASFIMVYNCCFLFFVSFSFVYFEQIIGIGWIFIFFSLCNLTAIFFVKFILIETRGKTIENIQKELNCESKENENISTKC